jgi:DNA-binding transcriptional MerR regulator
MSTDKAPDAFRTISEAAEELDLPQHVLRFWETRFPQIKPLKRGGGRRYYRPDDLEFLRGLKALLHTERYTIKGVQKIIKEQGIKSIHAAGQGEAPSAAAPPEKALIAPVAAIAPLRATPVARPLEVAPVAAVRPLSPGGRTARLAEVLADLIECQRLLAAARPR